MKREFLKGLGLDEEQITKVLDEHHLTTNEFKDKAEKVQGLEDELNKANEELKNRDAQIEELQEKIGDNDELKAEIENYKTENAKYADEIKTTRLDSAIKIAVAKDANDSNDILSLIDKSSLELQDDGTVKGLDDVLGKLRENKPYLFDDGRKTGSTPNAGEPVVPETNEAWKEFI